MTLLFLIPIIAYVIGSIPVGFLIACCFGVEDIRLHGSGNIGATNVGRVLGAPFFLLVFFLDFIKAYGFLYAATKLGVPPNVIMMSAVALLLGNGCSIFLNFQGGKLIATSAGIVTFVHPLLSAILVLVWLIAFCVIRIVGISSVIGLFFLPLIGWYLNVSRNAFLLLWFIAAWGIWRHQKNIINYVKKPIGKPK